MELPPNFSVSLNDDVTSTFTPERERQIIRYLGAAHEEAKLFLQQSEEIKNYNKYIEYLMGHQWPSKRPSYKAAPVDNRLWKILTDLESYLTDIRPTWDVGSNNKTYAPQAEILKKLTEGWWLAQDVDMSLAQIVVYAAITTGYGRLCWNPALCGGLGDQELRPVSPLDLYPIRPMGTDMQSCQGVVYRAIRPLTWFRAKYGNRGAAVKADPTYSSGQKAAGRPPWITEGVWTLMSPGMKRIVGVKSELTQSVFPMAEYREFWLQDDSINYGKAPVFVGEPGTNWFYKVLPGAALYPRGRLLITGGNDVLLHDGPNPFWHGKFPFDKLCLNTVPWQWFGPSEFRVQIPLQDIVNQILAGVLDIVKKACNPIMMAPDNAFSTAVKMSLDHTKPGEKLFYNPNQGQTPKFENPPQLPGYVLETMAWAIREMDNASGILDLQSIARLGQVPAADTLEQLKEGQQSVIRLKGRYIETFLRNIGTMAISNFCQFYTAERRIRLLGNDGLTFEDFGFDPGNMLPNGADPQVFAQNFVFDLKPGSALGANRSQREYKAFMLRRQGDMDRRTFLDIVGFSSLANTIEKNLENEGKNIFLKLAAAQAGKGGGSSGQLLNALQGSEMGGSSAVM